MRAALVIHEITADLGCNRTRLLCRAREAARGGADLVLFPEAAVTGLINNDDPSHDLPLGERIPGPFTARLAELAAAESIWLGLGLLETDGYHLWDSAILISGRGDLVLHYRRIQPQWHGARADPSVYLQGHALSVATTPFGTLSVIICGDLFDDAVVMRLRALAPDYVWLPFARCFADGSHDQERWEREEWPAYAERVRLLGRPVLMVNSLSDRSWMGGTFGGAMVVAGNGALVSQLPLGRHDILSINIPLMHE